MVHAWVDFVAHVKAHYASRPDELKVLGYTVLAAAFILSFNKWGESAFDAAVGFGNLLAAVVVCAVGIFIHDAAHRLAAIQMGYEVEHRVWFGGLILSIILVMASRGVLKTYFFESMVLSPVRLHRMGRYPFMGTTWEYALVYMAGPLANLLVAGLLASIAASAGIKGGVLGMAVQFNLAFGLLCLVPLPPLDGLWILFYSRGVYGGLIVGALSYILMTQFGLAYGMTLALSVVIGIVAGIYWMKFHD